MRLDPEHYKTRRRRDVPGDHRNLCWHTFRSLPLLSRPRTAGWTLDAIEAARSRFGFRLTAYCVMPNHVHLLVRPDPRDARASPILSAIKQSVAKKVVRWLKAEAPAYLQELDESDGGSPRYRFWRPGGGYDGNVRTLSEIEDTRQYIRMNPVSAGLVGVPEDWPWSCATRTVGGRVLRIDPWPPREGSV